MASNNVCESCLAKEKSAVAVHLCTDCDERLCEECKVHHLGFKAFKSHHIIEINSVPANFSTFEKNCSIHDDMLSDFYCSFHDVSCCRMCLSETHRLCEYVLPLEIASRNVKESSLLKDTLVQLDYNKHTLQRLGKLKEANKETLLKSTSATVKEIASSKQRIITRLDNLEQQLINKLNVKKENIKCELETTKDDIEKQIEEIEVQQQELEFLTKHSTNNQLFLALHKYEKMLKLRGTGISDMISKCQELDISYTAEAVNIKSLGTITETMRPCDIQYTPVNLKQAQTQSDTTSASLTKFKRCGEIQLKSGEDYSLIDIAVTNDNKLLLCNNSKRHPKVYIYTDCKRYHNEIRFSGEPWRISVIPGTSRAVAILNEIKSMQLFNTTSFTQEEIIKLGFRPWGITATTNKILVAETDKLYIFDTKGTFQDIITILDIGCNFVIGSNMIFAEGMGRDTSVFCCYDLYGNESVKYDINVTGTAVDGQGYVYVAECNTNKVHRISPDSKSQEVILTSDDGVRNPCEMTFNNTYDRLFMLSNDKRTVSCFACS